MVIDAFEEPLPENQDALSKAFLREGGLKMVNELWEWTPTNLTEEDR